MSACAHAEPLGEEGWNAPIEEIRTIRITCSCGWRGCVTELMTCGLPAEEECGTDLWCPVCGTIGWIYD